MSEVAGASKEPESHKIFVGGVSWNTEEPAFKEFFAAYGEITDAVVMRSAEGKSRGFGFVTFTSAQAVEKCMSEALELDGRRLDVKKAVPRGQEDRSDSRRGGGGQAQTSRPTKKVFIGGLAPETTKEGLDEHFGKYGTITDSIVMQDRDTGRSRGFGFVTYDNENSVEALMKDDHMLDEKSVECKRAVPREELDEPRRGGGGGGGYGPPRGGGGKGGGGYGGRRGPPGGGYDRRGPPSSHYGRGGGYDDYDRGGGYGRPPPDYYNRGPPRGRGGYDDGYGGGYGGGYEHGGGGYDGGYDRGGYGPDRGYGGGGGGGYGQDAGYGAPQGRQEGPGGAYPNQAWQGQGQQTQPQGQAAGPPAAAEPAAAGAAGGYYPGYGQQPGGEVAPAAAAAGAAPAQAYNQQQYPANAYGQQQQYTEQAAGGYGQQQGYGAAPARGGGERFHPYGRR